MPELPEVETLRRSLEPICHRHITSIYFSPLAPVESTTKRTIRGRMAGSELTSLSRWGKYLLLINHEGTALVIHLGMGGRLLFYEQAWPIRPPHTHMEIAFSDGTLLRHIDARRFGTISLSVTRGHRDNPFLSRLGPDYLAIDPGTFIQRCRRHSKLSLKSMALHQGIAAGLGNIYACEALYQARLDPRRLIRRTSDGELTHFLVAAQEVLALGIRYGGTTFRDYLDGRGHRGTMQEFLQVYDREGKPPREGQGSVVRIVQNARSTWFCPTIQK